MLRKLKSQKGFTLVEVIVVAVIVLILAAVAIPLYNGYITDSRKNVAENTAGSLASALAATVQQDLTDSITVDDGLTGEYKLPSISGAKNTFRIPNGYEVNVSATEVKCQYTGNDLTLSNAYVYKGSN